MASLSLRGALRLCRAPSTGRLLTCNALGRVGEVVLSETHQKNNEMGTSGYSLTNTSSSILHHEQSHHHTHRRFFSRTCCLSRKGAKMGQHLESLEEQAHRKEHDEAVARRKGKKAKKKAHRGDHEDEFESLASTAGEEPTMEDVQFDENDDKFQSHDKDDKDALPSLPDPKEVRERLMKVVGALQRSFKSIRGNEPTPDLFEHIIVEAYGERTHLSNVAQVVVVSPTLVTVTCFDPSLGKDVRNAIRDASHFDGSLNPLLEEDGQVKVPVPRPSAETRQKTVKQLKKQAEAGRQRLRKIRRAAMEVVKQAKDGKLEGISKDDAFRVGKDIDHATEDVTSELNDEVKKKEDSIMEV